MALIKCSECSKEVSDQATSCPNCGFPMTSTAISSRDESAVNISLGYLEIFEGYSLNPQAVCPHCGKRGCVATKRAKAKKGLSGAKATGAILTGGLSILATGLSRKEWVTDAKCKHCRSQWIFWSDSALPKSGACGLPLARTSCRGTIHSIRRSFAVSANLRQTAALLTS